MSVSPYDSNMSVYSSSLTSISPDDLTAEEINMFENFLTVDEAQEVMNQGYNTFTLNDLTKEDSELIIAALEEQYEEIEQEFETAKNSNGWISGAWNAIKNFTGIGASSNKTQKELDNMKEQLSELKKNPDKLAEVYKNITGKELTSEELTKFVTGETSLVDSSKAGESINKYSEGQKMSTDIVADMVSGIVSVGTVAFGSAIGICAAPFTAGASLGLVAAGLGMAAGAGAIVKTSIKASDCIGNEKEYTLKNFGYDALTGAANGMMAPLSNALGGAAGTAIMKTAGMEALETTVVKSAAVAGGKAIVENAGEKAVLTAGQTAIKILASGTSKIIDGGLSGATDAFVRDIATGETDNILSDTFGGFAGGAAGGLIIGTGFEVAGNVGKKLGNTKIGKAIGEQVGTFSDDIGNKFSNHIDELVENHSVLKNVSESISELGEKINNKAVQTSLKNCLTIENDDIYNITIGKYTVKLAKDEIGDDVLNAIAKGDNTLIFKQAQVVLNDALSDRTGLEISEVITRNIDDEVELEHLRIDDEELLPEQTYKDPQLADDLTEINLFSSNAVTVDNIGEQKIVVKELVVDANGVKKIAKNEINIADWFNKYGVNISDVKPDAVEFFSKLNPDVITYLSGFELRNNQSYLQAMLTKSTGFENVDFSSLNKNADFLNFLNLMSSKNNSRSNLLEGVKDFSFIFSPDFDAEGMFNLFHQLGDIKYSNKTSFLDKYSNADLQTILNSKHIDTNKACIFIYDCFDTINSVDGTKQAQLINYLGSSGILDILKNESTDYDRIFNLMDYIKNENVFPDVTNQDMYTIAYMIDHVSNNGNISMENYVDLYKYFSNLTDNDGSKIFRDKLGSTSSINYIINNLDSSSAEASNIEMLIQLVQDGVVDKKVLNYMPKEGKINSAVVSDIEKLYDSYVMGLDPKEMFVPTFKNLEEALNGGNESILFKDTYKELNIGDVFQVNGEDFIRIKISDTESQLLNISKDSYYELFPPVTKYATVQNGIGNCWEITGINSLLSDSKARVRVLSCLGEEINENGEKVITVTFANNTTPSVKLVNGQIPENLEKYYSTGSKGIQLLEYADGVEINKEKVNAYLESLNKRIVSASTDEQRENLTKILVGLTEDIEKEGMDNINIVYNSQNTAIGYTKYSESKQVTESYPSYKSYTGSYGTASTESRSGGWSDNLYKRFGYSDAKRIHFSSYDKADIMAKLADAKFYDENIVSWASSGSGIEASVNDNLGIVSNHAYRLTPKDISSNGTVKTFSLINPWGIEETTLTLEEVYKYGRTIMFTN